MPITMTIGAKVTNAQLLKMHVDEVGGCRVCVEKGIRGTKSGRTEAGEDRG